MPHHNLSDRFSPDIQIMARKGFNRLDITGKKKQQVLLQAL